jgi:hypothetical protein
MVFLARYVQLRCRTRVPTTPLKLHIDWTLDSGHMLISTCNNTISDVAGYWMASSESDSGNLLEGKISLHGVIPALLLTS